MFSEAVTKSEFAELCGVTKGRVSQWIGEGKIGPAEMVGSGRNAKIKVAAAQDRLKIKLDADQRNGLNGLGTKLDADPTPSRLAQSEADQLDLDIKREKLKAAESQNRKLAEEEYARRGVYVRAEEASAEAGKLASTILQMFEGGMVDMASALSAKFSLPQRDVLHFMRHELRLLRDKIATRLSSDAQGLPEFVEDDQDI